MAIIKTDKMGCASFIYHTITATLNELINALGEPHFTDIDEDSDIQYEWRFKIENEGSVFSIYDWKEYHEIERDEKIEWHIGGISSKSHILKCESLIRLDRGFSFCSTRVSDDQVSEGDKIILSKLFNPAARRRRSWQESIMCCPHCSASEGPVIILSKLFLCNVQLLWTEQDVHHRTNLEGVEIILSKLF